MDDHVHDEIEIHAQRSDPAQIEKDSQYGSDDHSIDEGMLLDRAGHSEMAMRDQFHFGEHRKHAGHCKDTGKNGLRGGNDGEDDCQHEADLTKRRLGRLGERIVSGLDDFVN